MSSYQSATRAMNISLCVDPGGGFKEHPAGELDDTAPCPDFDHCLPSEFRGSHISSDAGLLACREREDAQGLAGPTDAVLLDGRRGKNIWHLPSGLVRQSVHCFHRPGRCRETQTMPILHKEPSRLTVIWGMLESLSQYIPELTPTRFRSC